MEGSEAQIQAILARNARVEQEKAWETSLTRRGFIAMITYLTATLFLWLMGNPLFYLNSLVPAAGYVLSTLSLPWVKKFWMKAGSTTS